MSVFVLRRPYARAEPTHFPMRPSWSSLGSLCNSPHTGCLARLGWDKVAALAARHLLEIMHSLSTVQGRSWEETVLPLGAVKLYVHFDRAECEPSILLRRRYVPTRASAISGRDRYRILLIFADLCEIDWQWVIFCSRGV